MEISLAGRAAVVTGGSKGVGLAVATRFAASGADVAIVARGREALDEAVKTIGTTARGRVVALQGDVAVVADIQRISPASRKLVLTAHENEEYIRAALNAGANGYVLKDANSAELMLAIRTVILGQQFLCKAIASKILSGYLSGYVAGPQQSAVPAVAQSITEREREVLTRIALGNSNKLIARELGVSPKTVEKHRSNLMRKLQLHNAAAITMFAIRNGMTSSAPLGIRGTARGQQFDTNPRSLASTG